MSLVKCAHIADALRLSTYEVFPDNRRHKGQRETERPVVATPLLRHRTPLSHRATTSPPSLSEMRTRAPPMMLPLSFVLMSSVVSPSWLLMRTRATLCSYELILLFTFKLCYCWLLEGNDEWFDGSRGQPCSNSNNSKRRRA